MTEGEKTRLIAWSNEMRNVHERLRKALRVTQEAIAAGDPAEPAARDLLLFCHGFCAALTGHHEGEDRELFPAIARAHPELRETIRYLEQDHSMIGHLLDGLQAAVDQAATPEDLGKHLEGIAAIMESHFRFEERKLLGVLEGLALDADVGAVFGPLSPGQVASGHGGAWRSAPGAALALQRAHTSRATTVRSPPWT